jgi:hypothetical protein
MNDHSKQPLKKGCLWGTLITLPFWLLILYFCFK